MTQVAIDHLLDQSPQSVAAGARLWTLQGHITGLQMEYKGANAITLSSGSAFIPDPGYAVELKTPIDKTLSLGANRITHLYLFKDSQGVDIEASTAPPVIYSGTARIKTNAPSRRYLGSITTGNGGTILPFVHEGPQGRISFPFFTGTGNYRLVNTDLTTARRAISALHLVPVSCSSIFVRYINVSGQHMILSPPDRDDVVLNVLAGEGFRDTLTLKNGAFGARTSAPASAAQVIDLHGYYFGR